MARELIINRNKVSLNGVLCPITIAHELSDKGVVFYKSFITVERNSGVIDYVPVIIPEDLLEDDYSGLYVHVTGCIQSYNMHTPEKTSLIVYVYVNHLSIVDTSESYVNNVELEGYVCNKPKLRNTSKTGRVISDIMLANNRPYYGCDYIPCICWGEDAEKIVYLGTGAHVKFTGRFQSREYRKYINETEYDMKTTYEVSVKEMQYLGGHRDRT